MKKAYRSEKIDLGDDWELVRGYETEECYDLSLIRVPTGKWPLSDEEKQAFRTKLAAVMNEVGDQIWKRCQVAE